MPIVKTATKASAAGEKVTFEATDFENTSPANHNVTISGEQGVIGNYDVEVRINGNWITWSSATADTDSEVIDQVGFDAVRVDPTNAGDIYATLWSAPEAGVR